MITPLERSLICMEFSDPLPSGGVEYQLHSFSGFGADSTESWNNTPQSLKITLWQEFGIWFYPGSLNVHTVQGEPWIPPASLNPVKIILGVFHRSCALPVILNEKCVGIAAAVNIRGFDPATCERILPTMYVDVPEIYAIFSPVNIRERLGLEDKETSDDVVINARLLSGDLLR